MSANIVCLAAVLSLATLGTSATHARPFARSSSEASDLAASLTEDGVDVTKLAQLVPLTDAPVSTLRCEALCSTLASIYGTTNVLGQNSTDYLASTSQYWANQEVQVRPKCCFKPTDAKGISLLVRLSRFTKCPFAVKSGGHGSVQGASTIQGGVVISLELLKAVDISEDRTIVSVEPGNTWFGVYAALEGHDLTVIGGRVASVGTGGLTTGGGISFLSNLYGWACDNVASYEVVTADGALLTVSPTQDPDLYFALRGGGPNFAIVTKFHFMAHSLPDGEIWGGTRIYTEEAFPAIVDAFTSLSNNIKQDPNAGTWLAWVPYNSTNLGLAELYYAQKNGSNATIFNNYTAVPAISDTTAIRKLTEYTTSIDDSTPPGLREYFYVITFRNSAELNSIAKDIYFSAIPSIANIPGAFPSLTFQSITVAQIEHMANNGGNALGLTPSDGPLTMASLQPRWANAEDDEAMYAFGSAVLAAIKEQAEARGLQSDYLYMNYAAQYQDVIASYGLESKSRLLRIAEEYDPEGVFQTLMPGYFKLDGAAVQGSGFFNF